ncbi:MAG: TetR/AcrR family transcriptional regulator [Polyangiaceae bacterium]|nr:TetR/AcrR family transcriptional regulator [Polyangiaceae bacterium]
MATVVFSGNRIGDLLRRIEASTGAPTQAPTEQELHILKCAMRWFAARGFAATTVRSIAAEAGVTGPMINYYFGSKEQLYRRLVEVVSIAMQERVARAAEGGGVFRERLGRVMHAYVDFATESPDAVGLFFGAAFGPSDGRPDVDIGAIRDLGQVALTSLLADAVAGKELVLRPGYGARDLLDLCIAAIVHVLGRRLADGWMADAASAARMKSELDRMVLVFLDGIVASTEP